MDDVASKAGPALDAGPDRPASWWGPAAVVLVNLLLGVPGVVPIWLAWYFLSTGPLAAAGLTTGEPTENDGMGVVGVVILPVVVGGLLAWVLTGRAIRPHLRTTGSPWFWPVSLGAVLAPTAWLILTPLVG